MANENEIKISELDIITAIKPNDSFPIVDSEEIDPNKDTKRITIQQFKENIIKDLVEDPEITDAIKQVEQAVNMAETSAAIWNTANSITSEVVGNPVTVETIPDTILTIKPEQKNLLQNIAQTQTINGVTFTVNSDGTVRAEGIASSLASFTLFGGSTPNVQQISFDYDTHFGFGFTGSSTTFYSVLYTSDGTKVVVNEVTIAGGVIIYGVQVRVSAGITANHLFSPQLEFGGIATAYVPHKDISVMRVFQAQKNLLINKATSQVINGATFTVNEDKTITVNGTSSTTAVLWVMGSNVDNPEKLYVPEDCSLRIANTGFLSTGLWSYVWSSTGNFQLMNTSRNIPKGTYIYGVTVSLEGGATASNLKAYPQLVLGTTADSSTYTPYHGTVKQVGSEGEIKLEALAGDNYLYSDIPEVMLRVYYENPARNILSEVTENESPIFSYFGVTTEKILDTSDGAPLYFRAEQMYNSIIRVTSMDGEVLPITNVMTGMTERVTAYSGIYRVNTRGNDEVRISRINSNTSGVQYSSITRLFNPRNTEMAYSHGYGHGIPLNSSVKVLSLPSCRIFGARNGKFIGSILQGGRSMLTVWNEGETPPMNGGYIGTETTHPIHMEIIEGGLLAVTQNGRILRSEDDTTWTQVLDLGGNVYMYGGITQLDVYGNIVVANEYRPTPRHTIPISNDPLGGGKVYLSLDGGKTFKTIFDIATNINASETNTHIHAVKFDPYENIIWIVTGDGPNHSSVRYTMDFGETWHLATGLENCSVQHTCIYPLPDCVLFGSDARVVGVARYHRPDSGTRAGATMYFDFPHLVHQFLTSDGDGIPVATRGGIDYNKGHVVYGYFMSAANYAINPVETFGKCSVWMSDGYKFRKVYQHGEMIPNGITGTYYDAVNNQYIVRLGMDGLAVIIQS